MRNASTMDDGTLLFLLALVEPMLAGADVGEWIELARCAEYDPEIFFPLKGESAQPARVICAQCQVRAQCLAWSIRTDEEHGVWGGLNRAERVRVRNAIETHEPAVKVPGKGAA